MIVLSSWEYLHQFEGRVGLYPFTAKPISRRRLDSEERKCQQNRLSFMLACHIPMLIIDFTERYC